MTELDPEAYGPTLALPGLEPVQECGCPDGEGHRCRPPWMSPEEWAVRP